MHRPQLVEATPENTTVEKITQKVIRVDKSKKTALAIKLVKEGNWEQVLIFTRTKHGANRLSKKLVSSGISSAAIHGNKSQAARTKALKGFKVGDVRVLVATDIAARGLDIPLLPHVINFELPNIPEDYVHRIGRTGRAGESGIAISLVSLDEVDYLRGIEKLVKIKFDREVVSGFETTETAEFVAENERLKKERRSGGRSRGNYHGNRGRNPKNNTKKKVGKRT